MYKFIMKGTLYFDVDGVLLNFSEPFAEFWNKGLDQGLWKGNIIEGNHMTWNFGDVNDMQDIKGGLDLFHQEHDHLPLMHEDIVSTLHELHIKYRIELITSYPNEKRRIENLARYNIPYDKLSCNVKDKLEYIQNAEAEGVNVVAIFEDGPHHLDMLLPKYGGKIWTPEYWNYLRPYYEDTRIHFYDSPHEWKKLL